MRRGRPRESIGQMRVARQHATVGLLVVGAAISAAAAWGAVAPPATSRPSEAGRWGVERLPRVEAGRCYAAGIDRSRQVAGYCRDPTVEHHPVVWRGRRAVRISRMDAFVTAINDRGDVVGGTADAAPWGVRAFLWQRGKMRNLGALGRQWSRATALNRRGEIVGITWSDAPPRPSAGFLRRRGRMTFLPPARTPWDPAAISDNGVIVGVRRWSSGRVRAVVLRGGRLVELGTLGGRDSAAASINSAGVVVGWSNVGGGSMRAFRWHGGRMVELRAPGALGSAATSVNDRGEIAGTVTARSGVTSAVVWIAGRMIRLPRVPGAVSTTAAAINEGGDVAGTAVFRALPDAELEPSNAVRWTRRAP